MFCSGQLSRGALRQDWIEDNDGLLISFGQWFCCNITPTPSPGIKVEVLLPLVAPFDVTGASTHWFLEAGVFAFCNELFAEDRALASPVCTIAAAFPA